MICILNDGTQFIFSMNDEWLMFNEWLKHQVHNFWTTLRYISQILGCAFSESSQKIEQNSKEGLVHFSCSKCHFSCQPSLRNAQPDVLSRPIISFFFAPYFMRQPEADLWDCIWASYKQFVLINELWNENYDEVQNYEL